MFKKNEAPISLFSFQDIVTSLIGIMLLILLLMCLQLLTKVETKQTSNERKETVEKLEKEKQQALQKKMAVQEQHTSVAIPEKYAHYSSYELNKITVDLRKEYARAKQKKQDEIEKQDLLEDKYQSAIKEEKSAEKVIKEVEKETKEEVRKIKKNIRDLNKQKEKLNQKIAASKYIKITYNTSDRLKPIVSVISGNKISVRHLAEKRTVFELNKTITKKDIETLLDKLKEYSMKNYHFVFLIKPSAANACRDLQIDFMTKFSGEEYGIEPIFEEEEIQ